MPVRKTGDELLTIKLNVLLPATNSHIGNN